MVATSLHFNNLFSQSRPFALSKDRRKIWATNLILSAIMHRQKSRNKCYIFVWRDPEILLPWQNARWFKLWHFKPVIVVNQASQLHHCFHYYYFYYSHNYTKILKSDRLSTALISAFIGLFNRTVRVITRALEWLSRSNLSDDYCSFIKVAQNTDRETTDF